MLYPLYDYYMQSDLSLEEIMNHYVNHFYLKKHGTDKVDKVLRKVSESSKMNKLYEQSARQGIAPNHIDFGSVINETMWFMLQSNNTQALAVLAAAIGWNKKVNLLSALKSEEDVRDDAIKIFKKFSIYGDMTQAEYDAMTNTF